MPSLENSVLVSIRISRFGGIVKNFFWWRKKKNFRGKVGNEMNGKSLVVVGLTAYDKYETMDWSIIPH